MRQLQRRKTKRRKRSFRLTSAYMAALLDCSMGAAMATKKSTAQYKATYLCIWPGTPLENCAAPAARTLAWCDRRHVTSERFEEAAIASQHGPGDKGG